ncbi:MAG: SCO family protein [Novosphingobium sp.]
MNRSAMLTRKLRIALLFPALALAACGGSGTSAPDEKPPLAGSSIGGPFTLTGEDGKPVHWSDFDGRYRIVYFGYTYCPDVCPLDVQTMVKGLKLFAKDHPDLAKEVQPIFISIDPARDTPDAMRQFTHAFSDKLVGLTGTPEQVATAAKAFAVYYARGESQPGGGYLMDHSRGAYLMGKDGAAMALIPVDKDAPAVATELARWVR